MEYMILIYAEEKMLALMSEQEMKDMMAGYGTYTQALIDAGVMRGGSELAPVNAATTVRVREGKTLRTDGPFAETREQLGGYYIIDCASLDDAIHWAAQCPSSVNGSIEVRPLVSYEA